MAVSDNVAQQAGASLAPPDVQSYRQAFRRTAGGVWIVTAAHAGQRTGLTATSVVSLSAEPAELMVSVQPNSSSFPMLLASGRFGVNLLAQGQQSIADRFAGRHGCQGEARYEQAAWQQTPEGVWLLGDAIVSMACTVCEVVWRRSHAIVVGQITALRLSEESMPPLVYADGGYTMLHPH